jgi:hypothetical protein
MEQQFPLGQMVMTAHASEALCELNVFNALCQHMKADWGDICDEDWVTNDEAPKSGDRLLSAYTDRNNVKFWIITEADRSATTVLLPEDY